MAPKILVADDESDVRDTIAEFLMQAGIEVFQACNGKEALDMLGMRPDIGLLFSDIRMPYRGGYELVQAAVRLRPHLKVLLMTGYPENPPAWLTAREIRMIFKPFNMQRMQRIVTDMVARP